MVVIDTSQGRLPSTDTRRSITPTTKLRPPRVRHAEVTRSRLLDDPSVVEATILGVHAPAGYGKTSFVVQWASRSTAPIVWVTCDESDNDPLVLMASILAGIEQSGAGASSLEQPLTVAEPAYTRSVLPAFAAHVASLNPAITIVLDEAQVLDEPQSLAVVTTLIRSLPTDARIALVGRSLRHLPIPLWRGQGLLRRSQQTTCPSPGPRRVRRSEPSAPTKSARRRVRRVPGLAGGGLAAQSARGSATSMNHVHEFIEAEVLAPLPENLRSFLCDSAVLGTVTADLAAEITGEPASAELLERHFDSVLIHDVGLDTYHFHPLLMECARNIYMRQDPQRLQNITGKAALWHLERGHLEQAVHLALTSGDWQTMGQVIWPAARLSLLQGRTVTVLGWLDIAGERALRSVPELSLTAAFAYLATGNLGNVLRYTQMTSASVPEDWHAEVRGDDVRSHLALLIAINHFGLNDVNEAVDLARAAVAAFEPDNPIQALGHLALALNLALTGDPQADEEFHVAAAISRSVGLASTEAESFCLHGLWQIAMSSDTAACENLESALAAYAFHDLKTMASTSAVIALARVALAAVRGNQRDMAEAITQQQTIDPEIGIILPWYRPLSGAILAMASVRSGDLDGYREYVSWCDDSQAPEAGMCTLLAARARRGYSSASPLAELSPAERRVWDLLMGRMTLAEIGQTLFLSRETVKSHTASIYRKLNVQSRRQAQDLAETWR